MVKPERAKSIENHLINQMNSGMIAGKVSENQVKQLLEQMSQQAAKSGKITVRLLYFFYKIIPLFSIIVINFFNNSLQERLLMMKMILMKIIGLIRNN